jgi:hypothetical protein
VNSFCGLIEFRLDHEPASVAPVAPIIREGIVGLLRDFGRFGIGGDDIGDTYGDLAERYGVVLSRLDPRPGTA